MTKWKTATRLASDVFSKPQSDITLLIKCQNDKFIMHVMNNKNANRMLACQEYTSEDECLDKLIDLCQLIMLKRANT